VSQRQYDRERERELIRGVKAGNPTAERALLEEHGGLMAKCAKRYAKVPGYDFEDAMQQARIGCIDAAMRFKLERNNKFATYASWRIRFHVKRWMQNTVGDIRTPRWRQDRPSHRPVRALSLDAPVRRGDTPNVDTLADTIPADVVPQDEYVDTRRTAERARAMTPRLLRGLDQRELLIVREHLCRDKADQVSLAEIGRRLGVSRERVRQVRDALVVELRQRATRMGGRELLAA
jgi:RNA polymerase sigma factor (sigma-70 family)